MNAGLSNCRKCKKLFQKMASDLCPPCIAVEEEQFRTLYRTLQKSGPQGGIAIEELSAEVGVPVEDIERFYLEGRLSTAGTFLKFQCQGCGVLVGEPQRKGRFCLKCSEETASKAGVEIKSRKELEKADEEDRIRQERLAMLKKNQSANAQSPRKFGMVRNS